ncbi:MAG: Arc family DNA binding domain-containing protein [Armatimonadetes bacterium]|nr:Arc family DNA binding domain-containing protein [Armatimonadota bacterium]
MAEKKAFILRIDKGLWDEVQRMAAAELRSVNAQIEYLLREAVAKRRRSNRLPDGGEPDQD